MGPLGPLKGRKNKPKVTKKQNLGKSLRFFSKKLQTFANFCKFSLGFPRPLGSLGLLGPLGPLGHHVAAVDPPELLDPLAVAHHAAEAEARRVGLPEPSWGL